MRYDDATKMHGRGRYRNFGRKYSKEKLHSEDTFSDRRKVDLSMWIRLIWLRIFVSVGI